MSEDSNFEEQNRLLQQELLRQKLLAERQQELAEIKLQGQKSKSTEILAIVCVLLFCAIAILVFG